LISRPERSTRSAPREIKKKEKKLVLSLFPSRGKKKGCPIVFWTLRERAHRRGEGKRGERKRKNA